MMVDDIEEVFNGYVEKLLFFSLHGRSRTCLALANRFEGLQGNEGGTREKGD